MLQTYKEWCQEELYLTGFPEKEEIVLNWRDIGEGEWKAGGW